MTRATTAAVPVDAAIEQVLRAEQAAREAVARCAADAELLVAQARAQALRIAARAALRSARVQAYAQTRLEVRLAAIEQARAALAAAAGARSADDARLRAALERLAAELTSES